MYKWELLADETAREIWDDALLRFDDYTPFQAYAWGEYRRGLGWEPRRWAAFNERREIVAMLQGSVRRYPFGFGLIWSEGGPVGDLAACDADLHEVIKRTTGLNRIYCRFRCDRQRHVADALRLSALGWNRSLINLTPNYSMSLDLNKDDKQALAACEQNWRRNLRRANEANLTLSQWQNPDVDEVLAVYASMQSLKGLDEQMSRAEVEQLLKHFSERIVLYRCDDEHGELVSLLGWIVFGKRAWAIFWATSEQGRKLHASFAIFWALSQHCRRLGLETCDLAGIDPVQNQGVYRFKKATGAVPLEYLGEWDWASSSWLRWAGNWAISRRKRLQRAESSFKSDTATISKTPPKPVSTTPATVAEGLRLSA